LLETGVPYDGDTDQAVGSVVGDMFGADPEATAPSYVIEQLEVFNWDPLTACIVSVSIPRVPHYRPDRQR